MRPIGGGVHERAGAGPARPPRVVMLLGNGFSPDPRVEAAASALARCGAEVAVVCWDRDGDLPEREDRGGVGVHRIRLPSTHGRGTSQALLMPRIWSRYVTAGRALRPDVVHAHDLDTLPAGHRLARSAGAALVFDAHESYPDMLAANVSPAVRWVTRRLERFLVPRTDLVVTVGDRLRAHYAAMGARDAVVVGNWRDAVETPERAPGDAPMRQAARGGTDAAPHAFATSVSICFIANLTAERRVEPLLEAVERVPDSALTIGGTGSAVAAVEAAAARCPRIRYLGPVPAEDVAGWTAASDAVYYGFDPANPNARFSAPNKLFEALAAGRPVITARFGEIGEIVAETGCGILVPDYTPDALAAAIRELRAPGRAETLRAAARRAAVRFTRRAADDALLTAYARILEPRRLGLGTATRAAG